MDYSFDSYFSPQARTLFVLEGCIVLSRIRNTCTEHLKKHFFLLSTHHDSGKANVSSTESVAASGTQEKTRLGTETEAVQA